MAEDPDRIIDNAEKLERAHDEEGGRRVVEELKDTLSTLRPERNRIYAWVDVERAQYADTKNNPQQEVYDAYMRTTGVGSEGHWFLFTMQYLKRADVLGLDTPGGRQALMKGLVTYMSMCESMIRVHGDPPMPGHPSGEIVT